MKHLRILEKIKAVGKRRQRQNIFDAASLGMFVAGAIVLSGLVSCWCIGTKPLYFATPLAFLGSLAVGGGFGIVAGILRRPRLRDIARLIDTRQSLADRVSTAIEILNRDEPNEIEKLQLDDTETNLAGVLPWNVVRYRFPRSLFGALAVYAVTVGVACVICLSHSSNSVKNTVAPEKKQSESRTEVADSAESGSLEHSLPESNGQANQSISAGTRKKILSEFEQATRTMPGDKTLSSLENKVKTALSTLAKDDVSLRDKVAAWSELESTFESLTNRLDNDYPRKSAAVLNNVAAILDESVPASGLGKALTEGNLLRMTQGLKELRDLYSLDKKSKLGERLQTEALEALDENANKSEETSNVEDTNKSFDSELQSRLAKSTGKLAEGVRKDDESLLLQASRELVEGKQQIMVRQEAIERMKELRALVEFEKTSFIQSISSRRATGLVEGQSRQAGNENWSRQAGSVKFSAPTEDWSGEKKTVSVSGLSGEGPSRREQHATRANAQAQANRRYREIRARFGKEVEHAMENETIPISQRQMIRKYFDSLEDETGGDR